MASGDRDYFRDRPGGGFNPLVWLSTGSVPIFRFAGIDVRAHAMLLFFIAWTILIGLPGQGWTWQDRFLSAASLFVIVLLHEFGHCFAARWVGGSANQIIMHPLGGLALASPPRRAWPTFLTVAGGPAVNVVICIVAALICGLTINYVPLVPYLFSEVRPAFNSSLAYQIGMFAFWIFNMSWILLIFNLIPIYPLDGGRMLQTALWPKFGYHKATYFSCIVGIVGSCLGIVLGIAFFASGMFTLAILGLLGLLHCTRMRQELLATWPEPWAESVDDDNFSGISSQQQRQNEKARRKTAKLLAEDAAERIEVDKILAKVSATGMNSLNWLEKRSLKRASEHQRERDKELGAARRRGG